MDDCGTQYATARYRPVLDAFLDGASDLAPGGGALCVYVDGVCVVDAQAGFARLGRPWGADTLATCFSATKALAAACLQVLVDRSLLDLEAPVADYWPEFARAGKDGVLVRHVLNHTSGVLGFQAPERLLDWTGKGWADSTRIAAALAESSPLWTPGNQIAYHGISFGWMAAELVARTSGITLGEFFRAEIAKPLGLDAWIGTPPSVHERIATTVQSGADCPPELAGADRLTRAAARDPQHPMGLMAVAMHGSSLLDRLTTFFDQEVVRSAEIPSSNATATASALARFYALLSMDGSLDGVRILSPEAVAKFRTASAAGSSAIAPAAPDAEGVLRTPGLEYALGYEANGDGSLKEPPFGPNPCSFGHEGAGNQLGFCDPDRRIAVGLLRSSLSLSRTFSRRLIDRIYECYDAVSPRSSDIGERTHG